MAYYHIDTRRARINISPGILYLLAYYHIDTRRARRNISPRLISYVMYLNIKALIRQFIRYFTNHLHTLYTGRALNTAPCLISPVVELSMACFTGLGLIRASKNFLSVGSSISRLDLWLIWADRLKGRHLKINIIECFIMGLLQNGGLWTMHYYCPYSPIKMHDLTNTCHSKLGLIQPSCNVYCLHLTT